MPKLLAVALVAAALFAQENNAPPPARGSVAGAILDADSGRPLPDFEVSVNGSHVTTGVDGRYLLHDIQPGQVRISVAGPPSDGFPRGFGGSAARMVTLGAGQDLSAVDFRVRQMGSISGKVVDQNKEPVPGVSVILIAREYSWGTLRYVFANAATTDDQGEYTMQRVSAGRAYLILAKRAFRRLEPISDAPVDRALRRPAVIPTYYPNSPSPEGAQPLLLRSGEHREGIDIRLVRTPSYCLEGVTESTLGPASLNFAIAERQPASGASGTGSMFMAMPSGLSGPEGKIRICDLHPGEYELTVTQPSAERMGSPAFFGATLVTVTDEDLRKVRAPARARVPVAGEVVWDGPAPSEPVTAQLNIDLRSITRTEYPTTKSSLPGEFSFDRGLLVDDYSVDVRGIPKGMYLKDVAYGGQSILREPLRVGSAMGDAGVRITVGRDGGTVSAKVVDGEGRAVTDCTIVVMPGSAPSEAAFAAALSTGRTDQSGAWTSATLAPGKYYALATTDIVDKSPECVGKLYRLRGRSEEIELRATGAANVTLAPRALE